MPWWPPRANRRLVGRRLSLILKNGDKAEGADSNWETAACENHPWKVVVATENLWKVQYNQLRNNSVQDPCNAVLETGELKNSWASIVGRQQHHNTPTEPQIAARDVVATSCCENPSLRESNQLCSSSIGCSIGSSSNTTEDNSLGSNWGSEDAPQNP